MFPHFRRFGSLLLVTLGLVASSALWFGCGPRPPEPGAQTARAMAATYAPERAAAISPEHCRACHAEEVAAWERSQHAVANRPLDEAIDRPRFDDPVAELASAFKPAADKELKIRGLGEGEPGPAQGVIGVEPLIQYLVAVGNGRWQAHELAYDPAAQEWFNVFGNDVFGDDHRALGDWGHWTGQGMNWNSNCAACHMTGYRKNYDAATDQYASTWVVHGISCVQCHRESVAHREAAEVGRYVPADARPNTPQLAMENCASCHSRRAGLTPDQFAAGDRFHDHYRLTLPDAPGIYFPDGQNRGENFTFGSLMLSRMGHAGVTCADCHEPHGHELILPATNNALCQRCHSTGEREAPIIDPVAHSHHPAHSTGNRCVECHMPHRTYMGRDPRRDHGFTSPDPELSHELGTPDACANCHADQSGSWVIEHANRWFASEEREERRARARMLARAEDPTRPFPTDELQAAADRTDLEHWKAAYLRLLARAPDASSLLPWAEERAQDAAGPVVRAAAIHLLDEAGASVASLEWALEDESRLVRLEAIEGVRERGGPLPPRAEEDYGRYLEANADRPEGALQMAERALEEGRSAEGRAHLYRAVSFDRNNGALHFQAALLLARVGAIDDALELLRRAPERARDSGEVDYAAGLLWAEKGNLARSVEHLSRAVERGPQNPRWWYNLALAQTKLANWPAALEAIEAALALQPDAAANHQLRTLILRRAGPR